MSAEQSNQPPVDDVADLEVDESEEIVGGAVSVPDINITKRVDKSSTRL